MFTSIIGYHVPYLFDVKLMITRLIEPAADRYRARLCCISPLSPADALGFSSERGFHQGTDPIYRFSAYVMSSSTSLWPATIAEKRWRRGDRRERIEDEKGE